MRALLCVAFVVACSSLALSCSKSDKPVVRQVEAKAPPLFVDTHLQPAEPVHAARKAVPLLAPIAHIDAEIPHQTPQSEVSSEEACSFTAPEFFGSLPARWVGGCKDGKAHGLGVLRSFSGKKVGAIFYGTMEHGNPKLGVVEDRSGLIIGRFADGGKPIGSDEFKDRLDGVNEAVAAATQIKEFYMRAGNTALAAFYSKKAKLLDKQIE